MEGLKAKEKIEKEFFLDFKTSMEVSKKLYPSYFLMKTPDNETGEKEDKKKTNIGVVGAYFKEWKDKKFFEEKEIFKSKINFKNKEYTQRINAFRLNLNFFFDYAKEKRIIFNNWQKDFLSFIFSNKKIREKIYNYDGDLISAIKNILTKLFILDKNLNIITAIYLLRNKNFKKLSGKMNYHKLQAIAKLDIETEKNGSVHSTKLQFLIKKIKKLLKLERLTLSKDNKEYSNAEDYLNSINF